MRAVRRTSGLVIQVRFIVEAAILVGIGACVSRLRPVLLAAGTTIVGMAPLLRDDFFREMAVSIMGGLAFGSVLALIALPVFYALLFSIGGSRKAT